VRCSFLIPPCGLRPLTPVFEPLCGAPAANAVVTLLWLFWTCLLPFHGLYHWFVALPHGSWRAFRHVWFISPELPGCPGTAGDARSHCLFPLLDALPVLLGSFKLLSRTVASYNDVRICRTVPVRMRFYFGYRLTDRILPAVHHRYAYILALRYATHHYATGR